jgi:hypothetical protein
MSRLTVSLPLPARLTRRKSSADRGHSRQGGRTLEGIGRPRTSNLKSVAHVI